MTTPTPVIQVSHLPSASSFYASITQPLGIRYLAATQEPLGPATLDFGRITDTGHEAFFSLTQVKKQNPGPATVVLPALTPNSVKEFWNKSRSLGQRDIVLDGNEEGEGVRAVAKDLDGNMLEAVYTPRGSRSTVTTMETASTEKEARRVLDWQKDVARSVSNGDDARTQVSSGSGRTELVPRRAESYPQPMRLVTRVTEHFHEGPAPIIGSAPAESSGISGKAIVGTLLGAAAGAAFAYAMVRSESPDMVRPEPAPRRASYTGPGGYTYEPLPTVLERAPAGSYASQLPEDCRPLYVEYAVAAPPPPPLARAYTHDLSRIDERSHISSQSKRSECRSTREQRPGEHSSQFERPLTIMPAPPRDSSPDTHVSKRSHKSHRSSGAKSRTKSHVSGSHHSEHSEGKKSRRSKSHASSGHHEDERSERESYTSARTHRTESTVKPAKSHASSVTTIRVVPKDREEGRSRVSAKDVPLPRSMVSVARDIPLPRSTVSVARDVPLPRSIVSGMGRDYADSVAPSDSVSSVGSKRERQRLVDRMSNRW